MSILVKDENSRGKDWQEIVRIASDIFFIDKIYSHSTVNIEDLVCYLECYDSPFRESYVELYISAENETNHTYEIAVVGNISTVCSAIYRAVCYCTSDCCVGWLGIQACSPLGQCAMPYEIRVKTLINENMRVVLNSFRPDRTVKYVDFGKKIYKGELNLIESCHNVMNSYLNGHGINVLRTELVGDFVWFEVDSRNTIPAFCNEEYLVFLVNNVVRRLISCYMKNDWETREYIYTLSRRYLFNLKNDRKFIDEEGNLIPFWIARNGSIHHVVSMYEFKFINGNIKEIKLMI